MSEGPGVDSGEIVICGERVVPRSRFGFPRTHSLEEAVSFSGIGFQPVGSPGDAETKQQAGSLSH